MAASQPVKSSVKKVCVIGPECTGKTDLSKFLSEHYNTPWVDEYARAYLNKLGRPYQQHDLTKIAHGQMRMEDEWLNDANKVLICDTNLLVIKIWSEYKFGACDKEILKGMAERKYDLYLLTNIDIPWQDDPQREHPQKREFFWNLYKKEVATTGVATVEISGSREVRRSTAIEAINKLIS
ncbi:MAG: AAA family ATPase [Bacteroidota bacterium]|jgi:NadR type nicotinamide-nucleotide adenylyltransferase|nr:ATP-binding protein [Cytophagales bacterium]MCE2956660.1 ATP-binding protein [Flammeovirgaceae bacterium]